MIINKFQPVIPEEDGENSDQQKSRGPTPTKSKTTYSGNTPNPVYVMDKAQNSWKGKKLSLADSDKSKGRLVSNRGSIQSQSSSLQERLVTPIVFGEGPTEAQGFSEQDTFK